MSARGAPARVKVAVNGEEHHLEAGATVEDVVTLLEVPRTGIAVALNGEVVPRGSWSATRLSQGDQVEVLTAVAGG
jgi:sulfur carrier protein